MHSYCATAQSIAEEKVSVNGEFLARATYLRGVHNGILT